MSGYVEHLQLHNGHLLFNEDGYGLNLTLNRAIVRKYHLSILGPAVYLTNEEWDQLNKEE